MTETGSGKGSLFKRTRRDPLRGHPIEDPFDVSKGLTAGTFASTEMHLLNLRAHRIKAQRHTGITTINHLRRKIQIASSPSTTRSVASSGSSSCPSTPSSLCTANRPRTVRWIDTRSPMAISAGLPKDGVVPCSGPSRKGADTSEAGITTGALGALVGGTLAINGVGEGSTTGFVHAPIEATLVRSNASEAGCNSG